MTIESSQTTIKGFTGFDQSIYGYAKYLAADSLTSAGNEAKTVARAKRYNAPKAQREKYPWPNMIFARRINMPESGKHWRGFSKTLEVRARHIGRSIALKSIVCEYVFQNELQSALDERFDSIASRPDQKQRLTKARDFINDANDMIAEDRKQQAKATLLYELAESHDLRKRAVEPDNPRWLARLVFDMADDLIAIPAVKTTQLWTPATFTIASQQGVGPNGIGVALGDEESIYMNGRRQLITKLCNNFNLNPVHFGNSDIPLVKFVDTSPLPAEGIKNFYLPAMSPDINFKEPRGYLL